MHQLVVCCRTFLATEVYYQPEYCTISINSPIGVTCDVLAEILVSARGENRCDKPPKYQIFARFWSIFWLIREMDSPIGHCDA